MNKRVPLSCSTLASSDAPIYELARKLRNNLYYCDPSHIYALMGAVAANCIEGRPVWLLLVGVPSCGGTSLVNTLMDLPLTYHAGSITSAGSLLCGSSKKESTKDSNRGLFKKVEPKGMLVFKDFTSSLSQPTETLKQVMDGFRQAYDGYWSRDVGTDGGKSVEYSGKMTVMGKCVPDIDNRAYHSISSRMGDRWIYYRYPWSSGDGEMDLDEEDDVMSDQEAKDLVTVFFAGLGLGFDQEEGKREKLTKEERTRMKNVAKFAALARASTSRNDYRPTVVTDPSYEEAPVRLFKVMRQLYKGMELVGLEERDAWDVVCKVALDSMPRIRKMAIDLLCEQREKVISVEQTVMVPVKGRMIKPERLSEKSNVDATEALITLEDLRIHGVLDKPGRAYEYRFNENARALYEAGWVGKEDEDDKEDGRDGRSEDDDYRG